MKSRTWIRLTAIGALLALAVLTSSICCTSAPIVTQQHECCKGRCASASPAVPLVALTQVKSRLPMLSAATDPLPMAVSEAASAGASSAAGEGPQLFAPIAIIQLRI